MGGYLTVGHLTVVPSVACYLTVVLYPASLAYVYAAKVTTSR